MFSILHLPLRCDLNFSVKRIGDRPLSRCFNGDAGVVNGTHSSSGSSSSGSGSGGNSSSSNLRQQDINGKKATETGLFHSLFLKKTDTLLNLSPSLPLISVMAATTTRRVKDPGTSNLALFMYLLPSLVRSMDCGYRYEYVLGFDKGDPFYDSVEVISAFRCVMFGIAL